MPYIVGRLIRLICLLRFDGGAMSRLYDRRACYASQRANGIVKAMNLVLLLLALLLTSCSTTQTAPSLTEAQAHDALVEVVRLSCQSVDLSPVDRLPLSVLLDSQSVHLLEQHDMPRLQARLSAWGDEVRAALLTTAPHLLAMIETRARVMAVADALAMVRSKSSATHLLKQQFDTELEREATLLLDEALQHSNTLWQTITHHYEIWRHGLFLSNEAVPAEASKDLSDHIRHIFLDAIFTALEGEEMLLRTTPVVKGSGSLLEVFQ